MTPAILGLATAVPPNVLWQDTFASLIENLYADNPQVKAYLPHLSDTAITKRHLAHTDFLQERHKWQFWGSSYPDEKPSTSQRNKAFQEIAPKLACKAAEDAIANWKGDPQNITHVISVSCTGLYAPGLEFELQQHLSLKPSICRLGINFMGCYGAFKALNVAKSFAHENPSNRILVVCTELCSLHLQNKSDFETLTGNAIFADGCAALIIGSHPTDAETPLWDIAKMASFSFDNTKDKITWVPGDHGFVMRLSSRVPALLKKYSPSFIREFLQDTATSSDCDFAIHPGGKSILQAIEKGMELQPEQTMAAWDTLANYGNMSSATFPFVLQHLTTQRTSKPWTVGLGFGPGLGIESVLLKKHPSIQA